MKFKGKTTKETSSLDFGPESSIKVNEKYKKLS
jgi:hypothetical protein